MDTVYKFFIWMIISFVVIYTMYTFIPNPVIFAFILALIVGFIGTKESK